MNSRNFLINELLTKKKLSESTLTKQIMNPITMKKKVMKPEINDEEEEDLTPKQQFNAIVNIANKHKTLTKKRKKKVIKALIEYYTENFPIINDDDEDIF
jgi:hypothetical protein